VTPWLPEMVLALAATVLGAAAVALPVASRGGRFRGLPGWVGWWGLFALLLVLMSRLPSMWSLGLLGVVTFVALREYFFMAPVRPQDRWAILVAYLTLPACLWAVSVQSYGLFLATVLLSLFLVLPAMLSLGEAQPGLLDSMGRVLLGLLVFVFCTAHLGWISLHPEGWLELFGILVLVNELPQRLAGRIRPGTRWRPLGGMVLGAVLAASLAGWLGPRVGIPSRRAMVVAVLVAVSVAAGRAVTEAVSKDLAMVSSASLVGRGALLDRTMPAVYAAPLFFHYLHRYV
jgi:phosphatidate cytidylyltransferase